MQPDNPWRETIIATLTDLWSDLTIRALRLSRVPLPPPWRGDEEALHSDLGLTLCDLAAVAEGEDRAADAEDVAGMVQSVCEALFARPGTAAYDVPAGWWAGGVGRLCRLALAVAEGDDALMTISEAAALLGVTTQAISAAVRDGRLQAITDAGARPRNQYGVARLVFRDEVERLRRGRERERER